MFEKKTAKLLAYLGIALGYPAEYPEAPTRPVVDDVI